MLAKSLKNIDMRPTALVPVITSMWRAIEPVTKRGGTGAGSASDAVDGALAVMASLSAVREPSATHKLQPRDLPALVGVHGQSARLGEGHAIPPKGAVHAYTLLPARSGFRGRGPRPWG